MHISTGSYNMHISTGSYIMHNQQDFFPVHVPHGDDVEMILNHASTDTW